MVLQRCVLPAPRIADEVEQFTASNASFESILSALSSYFLVESEDALLRWIRKVMRRTELRRQITGWREEWQGFVKDGSAESRTT